MPAEVIDPTEWWGRDRWLSHQNYLYGTNPTNAILTRKNLEKILRRSDKYW